MTVSVDRRPIIVAAGVGIMVLAAAGALDRLLMGVFACIGMILGYGNAWLARVSVTRISSGAESGTHFLAATNGLRLFGVTALALAVGVLARPDGSGILLGLVTFQIVWLLSTAAPVPRGVR
ncbi:hypothetical protein IU450_22445 [Nocardia abscessus]|uniref:hypothetical protein n=1 Tax=Nocardia abscessus TaxID=120957 RepID=UPI001895FC36|nr:hypothetical protein [Nocardia abscessus]MBF6338633.1 hypothetical protein [Nocardia abscessus]